MFVGCEPGEGTSSCAASFAVSAARRTEKPAWLVDLDLENNPIFKTFETGNSDFSGRPGRSYDASLRTQPFYTVSGGNAPEKLLTAHEIEGSKLIITRFRSEHLQANQRVEVTGNPNWWATLRRAAGWIVVDAPPLAHSKAALPVFAHMDGIILVVRADHTSAAAVRNATRLIKARGGTLLGIVMNKVGRDVRRQIAR